jgi:predicted lactoylglutathione lyase
MLLDDHQLDPGLYPVFLAGHPDAELPDQTHGSVVALEASPARRGTEARRTRDKRRVPYGRWYVVAVEQRISLVTLGVADVTRARTFYERLGWQGQEVEETAFFQAGGIALVLWGRDKLADDASIEDGTANGFGGVALAQNVRSRAEVDEVLSAAADAGAVISQAARETFYGGYAGYFSDPDGHVWEIAYNPGFTLRPDGTIVIPDFAA